MLIVETIANIRRLHFTQGKGIKTICRDLKLSKKVVRKVIRTGITEFTYSRTVQPRPKLGAAGAQPAVGDQRGSWAPGTPDADPDLRGTARPWL